MVEQTNAHDSATNDNDSGMIVYNDLQIQADGPERLGCKRNLATHNHISLGGRPPRSNRHKNVISRQANLESKHRKCELSRTIARGCVPNATLLCPSAPRSNSRLSRESLSFQKNNVAAAVFRDITGYTSTNNATADDDNMHVSRKFVRPLLDHCSAVSARDCVLLPIDRLLHCA